MASKKQKLQKGKSLVPLFELGADGETLVINREYVRGQYPFKDLLNTDNTKDKNQAYSMLMYIYLMNDYNSELDGLPINEKHEKAVVLSKIDLAKFPNFENTKVMKDATAYYNMIYEALNPQIKLYRALKRSLHTADKAVGTLIDRIENNLNNITKRQEQLANKTNPTPEELIIDISPILSDLQSLISLSKGLPDTIASIDSIFNSIKEEEIIDSTMRGGTSVGNRENPDYLKDFHKRTQERKS
jgi:hypothetical protein